MFKVPDGDQVSDFEFVSCHKLLVLLKSSKTLTLTLHSKTDILATCLQFKDRLLAQNQMGYASNQQVIDKLMADFYRTVETAVDELQHTEQISQSALSNLLSDLFRLWFSKSDHTHFYFPAFS